jgi:hypothetical protein
MGILLSYVYWRIDRKWKARMKNDLKRNPEIIYSDFDSWSVLNIISMCDNKEAAAAQYARRHGKEAARVLDIMHWGKSPPPFDIAKARKYI